MANSWDNVWEWGASMRAYRLANRGYKVNVLISFVLKKKINMIIRRNYGLTHSIPGKIFSRRHFEIFFLFFSQETGFEISCQLSPLHAMQLSQLETTGKKFQILILGKNEKYIINMSCAEFAQRVVKVEQFHMKRFSLSCAADNP